MDRDDFLKALRNDAQANVKPFLDPASSGWLTDVYNDVYEDGKEREIDTIYEILCYFSIADKLAETVSMTCIPGNGANGHRLAKKPGKKDQFMFLRFDRNGVTYDLCGGTEVEQKYDTNKKECPDITLQRMGALLAKNAGAVVAMWDAKYHQQPKGKTNNLTKADFQQMYFWCDVIEFPPYTSGDILEQLLPDIHQVCAIITNAPSWSEYPECCRQKRFSVVLDYKGPGTGNGPEPPTTDHR